MNPGAALNACVDILRVGAGSEAGHQQRIPGQLFDRWGHAYFNKDDQSTALAINRSHMGSGHGWAAVNSLLWNNILFRGHADSPCFGSNYATQHRIGIPRALGRFNFPKDVLAEKVEEIARREKIPETDILGTAPIFRNLSIGGYYYDYSNVPRRRWSRPEDFIEIKTLVEPSSLYVRQLIDRVGEAAAAKILKPWQLSGYGIAPTVELADAGRTLSFTVSDHLVTAHRLDKAALKVFWTTDVFTPDELWHEYDGPITVEPGKTYYGRIENADEAAGRPYPVSEYSQRYMSVRFLSDYSDEQRVSRNYRETVARLARDNPDKLLNFPSEAIERLVKTLAAEQRLKRVSAAGTRETAPHPQGWSGKLKNVPAWCWIAGALVLFGLMSLLRKR
jgi:hypothetical protein